MIDNFKQTSNDSVIATTDEFFDKIKHDEIGNLSQKVEFHAKTNMWISDGIWYCGSILGRVSSPFFRGVRCRQKFGRLQHAMKWWLRLILSMVTIKFA